mgnify:CR=1 FL=1|jgi:hypothetical protein|tara:strand:+ start:597 stop:1016 length:420 start_codon:yes stop_codon:yes gene_type:complete
MTQQIIKFNTGEEIIADIVKFDKDYFTIKNPMKMQTIPKMTREGVIESLSLNKWMHPYTEQAVCKIRKDTIITIVNASDGMKLFYNRQMDIANKNPMKLGYSTVEASDYENKDFANEKEDDWDESEIKKFLDAVKPTQH